MSRLFALFLFLIPFAQGAVAPDSSVANFWQAPRHGTNIFNHQITEETIREAKECGFDFIRIAPDKFDSAERDFLLGDADDYTTINDADFEHLLEILTWSEQHAIPVVLTMLSLPGSRWKQNNDDKDDTRIWTDLEYQEAAAMFWKDLAERLANYPIIVGYDILNEPHPEKCDLNFDTQKIGELINSFNEIVTAAIREVDPSTPIILESTLHADPQTFALLKPVHATNILYSFHMYEPFDYTNKKRNQGQYSYPGVVDGVEWDRAQLESYMEPVSHFQQKFSIPCHQILIGEFGAHRTSSGIFNYFQDLISIFKLNQWHFAFYSFREDTWDGMNYEKCDDKEVFKLLVNS